jgi:hypothetical protein
VSRGGAEPLLLSENVHPRVVVELLGHIQMRTTTDIYSHVMPTLAREAADRMGAVLLAGEAGPTATTTATTNDSGRPPGGRRVELGIPSPSMLGRLTPSPKPNLLIGRRARLWGQPRYGGSPTARAWAIQIRAGDSIGSPGSSAGDTHAASLVSC